MEWIPRPVVARLMGSVMFLALGVPIRSSQPEPLRLEASFDAVHHTLHLRVVNDSATTFLAPLGGLFGKRGGPGFRWTLLGPDGNAQSLYLSYNEPGVVEGRADPWVAVLTPSTEFGFTFRERQIRFRRPVSRSLADRSPGPYKLAIVYASHPDRWVFADWRRCHGGEIPFWTGELRAEVELH